MANEHNIKEAVDKVGTTLKGKMAAFKEGPEWKSVKDFADKLTKGGASGKNALGLSDDLVESIYGQAFRLYNTGKYKDASHVFRLLIILDPNESKYSLGLAACFHMLKDYENATQLYLLCGALDPDSPIPHYHASDCYLQTNDKVSALIALEMAIKRAGEKPEYKTLKDRSLLTAKSLKQELLAPKDL